MGRTEEKEEIWQEEGRTEGWAAVDATSVQQPPQAPGDGKEAQIGGTCCRCQTRLLPQACIATQPQTVCGAGGVELGLGVAGVGYGVVQYAKHAVAAEVPSLPPCLASSLPASLPGFLPGSPAPLAPSLPSRCRCALPSACGLLSVGMGRQRFLADAA